MGDVGYGFAHDFYRYVLKDLGFDVYRENGMTAYYIHLLIRKYGVIWASSNARGFLTVLLKRFPFLKKKMRDTKLTTRFHRECDALFREKPKKRWMPYMSIVGSDKVAWVYDCYDRLKQYVPKLHKNDFHVVHNGVDLNQYTPSEMWRQKKTIFTLSSWHTPKKRLETLIGAMNYLPEWHLDIAGKFLQKEYYKECVCARARLAKPIRDRIRFRGFVNEKIHWFQRADVFVMPSKQEAWSTQVMEAMSCGCKVVAPNVGGMPEFVPKDELIPIDVSPNELAEKVLSVADNQNLRRKNRMAVMFYSWGNVKRETEAVLVDLCT